VIFYSIIIRIHLLTHITVSLWNQITPYTNHNQLWSCSTHKLTCTRLHTAICSESAKTTAV